MVFESASKPTIQQRQLRLSPVHLILLHRAPCFNVVPLRPSARFSREAVDDAVLDGPGCPCLRSLSSSACPLFISCNIACFSPSRPGTLVEQCFGVQLINICCSGTVLYPSTCSAMYCTVRSTHCTWVLRSIISIHLLWWPVTASNGAERIILPTGVIVQIRESWSTRWLLTLLSAVLTVPVW